MSFRTWIKTQKKQTNNRNNETENESIVINDSTNPKYSTQMAPHLRPPHPLTPMDKIASDGTVIGLNNNPSPINTKLQLLHSNNKKHYARKLEKPKSAFFLFVTDVRQTVKQECGLTGYALNKKISEQWKLLAEHKKDQYRNKADKLNLEYDQALDEYNNRTRTKVVSSKKGKYNTNGISKSNNNKKSLHRKKSRQIMTDDEMQRKDIFLNNMIKNGLIFKKMLQKHIYSNNNDDEDIESIVDGYIHLRCNSLREFKQIEQNKDNIILTIASEVESYKNTMTPDADYIVRSKRFFENTLYIESIERVMDIDPIIKKEVN